MSAITVQRVARHKDGWKMRFTESRNGMITTVIVLDQETSAARHVDLSDALRFGRREAEMNFELMAGFNDEQARASRRLPIGNNGLHRVAEGRRH